MFLMLRRMRTSAEEGHDGGISTLAPLFPMDGGEAATKVGGSGCQLLPFEMASSGTRSVEV